MNSFFSVIKFVNNNISQENIAVGLIVISEGKIFYDLSSKKLDLVKKLNPRSFPLFKIAFDNFSNFLYQEVRLASNVLLPNLSSLGQSYFKRLSAYQTGLLQISEPVLIRRAFDQDSFYLYYNKIINAEASEVVNNLARVKEYSPLQREIDNNLIVPLNGLVDTNYKLRRNKIPSLFFDFTLDAIGVNGSIYAVKAIDIDNVGIQKLNNQITSYESVIDRLKIFGKNKRLGEDHRFFLVVDPPSEEGKDINDRQDIYSALKAGDKILYDVVGSNKIKDVSDIIIDKHARPFSRLLPEN